MESCPRHGVRWPPPRHMCVMALLLGHLLLVAHVEVHSALAFTVPCSDLTGQAVGGASAAVLNVMEKLTPAGGVLTVRDCVINDTTPTFSFAPAVNWTGPVLLEFVNMTVTDSAGLSLISQDGTLANVHVLLRDSFVNLSAFGSVSSSFLSWSYIVTAFNVSITFENTWCSIVLKDDAFATGSIGCLDTKSSRGSRRSNQILLSAVNSTISLFHHGRGVGCMLSVTSFLTLQDVSIVAVNSTLMASATSSLSVASILCSDALVSVEDIHMLSQQSNISSIGGLGTVAALALVGNQQSMNISLKRAVISVTNGVVEAAGVVVVGSAGVALGDGPSKSSSIYAVDMQFYAVQSRIRSIGDAVVSSLGIAVYADLSIGGAFSQVNLRDVRFVVHSGDVVALAKSNLASSGAVVLGAGGLANSVLLNVSFIAFDSNVSSRCETAACAALGAVSFSSRGSHSARSIAISSSGSNVTSAAKTHATASAALASCCTQSTLTTNKPAPDSP